MEENKIKQWKAIPNISIGDIKFGMDRKAVRMLFENKYTEFKKTPLSKNTTDDFGAFHVYYDNDDKCEAIEVFEDTEILLNDTVIFPNAVAEIIGLFTDLEYDGYGYTSISTSIGITPDDDGNIDAILFGCKDYYV